MNLNSVILNADYYFKKLRHVVATEKSDYIKVGIS